MLVGLAAPALGADSPNAPPTFAIPGKAEPTLKSNPTNGALRIGSQTVRLEDTELLPLANRLDLSLSHRGEGREAMKWICLTDEAAQMRLWLVSHDDSDGSVDTVTLVHLPNVKAVEHCPDLPAQYRQITLLGGVTLGMAGDAFKAKLGKPTYDDKGLIAYMYKGDVVLSDGRGVRGAEVFAAVGSDGLGAISLHQHTLRI
jgi:hypothetical protein